MLLAPSAERIGLGALPFLLQFVEADGQIAEAGQLDGDDLPATASWAKAPGSCPARHWPMRLAKAGGRKGHGPAESVSPAANSAGQRA